MAALRIEFAGTSYGSLNDLRDIILQQDVTLIALDTEFKGKNLSEIGITQVRARDLASAQPGPYCRNWVSMFRNYHIVVTGHKNRNIKTALFARSNYASPSAAREMLLDIFRAAGAESSTGSVVLVGQSLTSDLSMIQDSLSLSLRNSAITGVTVARLFDTLAIGKHAKKAGARLPALNLSAMVRALGIEEKYWNGGGIVGWHNASNDAAYTMAALLLFAVRWEDIIDTGIEFDRQFGPVPKGDPNLTNLETFVRTHGCEWHDKVFNYRMHPENIRAHRASNVHYAGVANNHTLDSGETGLTETIKAVQQAGIAFAGPGKDEVEATRPAIRSLPSSDSSQPPYKVCIWAASFPPRD
ncbi:hypothetical protein DOTSEDRAFT_76908 [Lecanosticta acicola]|uniref:Capsule synthesis protein CapA domain-containing protein n=1 Tax=Lecanosticta acicola TaxID=111012 RepID=A0AAI8YUH2_9PEZI|nr:hypothetical protein DOTSEDRAFT_76908 [Lecanosticta acicola]